MEQDKSAAPGILDWEFFSVVYLRVIAVFFIFFTLRYWLQIVGFYEGDNYRFDTMPEYWKVTVAIMAVIAPLTALGLWGTFSWAYVVWAVAIVTELIMFVGYPDLFGSASLLVIFHVTSMGIYIIMKLLHYIKNRQRSAV